MAIEVQVIPFTGEQVVEAWGECVFDDLSSFTKLTVHQNLETLFYNFSSFINENIVELMDKLENIHNGYMYHLSSTPYTIKNDDIGKLILVGSESLSSNTIIIPNDSNSDIDNDSLFYFSKYGNVDKISLSAENGVEFVGNSTLELSAQTCIVYKKSENNWVVMGDYLVDALELNT